MKLNLGSGQNKQAGFINVDKYDTFAPDILADLEILPWPFEDNSADEIRMSHVLEHLGATTGVFLGIIRELYRVLKPQAPLHIRVPHPRSEHFIGDPTHVRPISPAVLALFSQKHNRESQANGWSDTTLGLYLGVDFEVRSVYWVLARRWAQRYSAGEISKEQLEEAMETYNNVVDEIEMVLVKVA
jgi:ubiquinone/menaquinone biosynthesis C-methylase UbiE